MYLSGVNYESVVDGVGVRTVFFVSGCKHNCMNCWSSQTHNFSYGSLVTAELIDVINKNINKRSFLSGITISGGDAMFSPLETVNFLEQIVIPKNNIWIYTGFKYEDIIVDKDRLTLLKQCNILVDGKFDEKLKDTSLKFRNSKNQRIIDIKSSLQANCIVELF